MNIRIVICLLLLEILACPSLHSYAQEEEQLPKALKIDLLHLKEAYNILDLYAKDIWPGWNDYDKYPVLFVYPNGLKMLTGQLNPPAGFDSVKGFLLRGKKIYIDRRGQNSENLDYPLLIQENIDELVSFYDDENKAITIRLEKDKADQPAYDKYAKLYGRKNMQVGSKGEEQILSIIHKLFHQFQRPSFKTTFSIPAFNCDLNYAIYSEMEANKLEKILSSADTENAKQYLKDFLVSRNLKNKSINSKDRKAVSAIELYEGTASYAELKALQLMNSRFTADSALLNEDKHYSGFKYREQLINNRTEWLGQISKHTFLSNLKAYPYGCAQALILDKLFPKWKELIAADGSSMDQILSRLVKIRKPERLDIAGRLSSEPEFASALERHSQPVSARDSLCREILSPKGRVFVIDLKNFQDFIYPENADELFQVGSMRIYPNGIGNYSMNNFELKCGSLPVIFPFKNFIKIISRHPLSNEDEYKLTYSGKDGADTFYNAALSTDAFELKAAKLRIIKNKDRIKLVVFPQ
jgi:hypothetical protein